MDFVTRLTQLISSGPAVAGMKEEDPLTFHSGIFPSQEREILKWKHLTGLWLSCSPLAAGKFDTISKSLS